MSNYLLVATLPHLDGYARDDVKISAAFTDTADTPNTALAMFRDFFTVLPAGATYKVGDHIGGSRSRAANACYIQAFDISGKLDGTPHGSAIATQTFTLPTPISTIGLPTEVAACIQLRGANYASLAEVGGIESIPTPMSAQEMGAPVTHTGRVRPRARRRGRMYVGPLSTSAVDSTDSDKRPRLEATFRATLGLAAKGLATTNGTCKLGVWSRRDEVIANVEQVLVDDAFDTQRRRGEKFVNRTSWTP